MSEEFFIQGNEACAKGALKAGCRFFAGYPITPSTEVAETLARELPKVGGDLPVSRWLLFLYREYNRFCSNGR